MKLLSASLTGIIMLFVAATQSSCDSPNTSNRDQQAEEARRAAQGITFDKNAEIDNITRRLKLTSKPGVVGYVLLMNMSGAPIMYETVIGKITSGSKRLTPPAQWYTGSSNGTVGPAPSDEGTWGSSNEFVFYWNDRGEYRQWNGPYLYSDKPFRTTVEPLVIAVKP